MLVTPLNTIVIGKSLFMQNETYEAIFLENTGVHIKGSNGYIHYFSQNVNDTNYYLTFFKEV